MAFGFCGSVVGVLAAGQQREAIFPPRPIHSGITGEGSCLVSFWISCVAKLVWLPGTDNAV